MALSSGTEGNGKFPTHYCKPAEGGIFDIEIKQNGVWTRLQPSKPIRTIEGDLLGIGFWSATYKSGRYAGQTYHILALRLTDGDEVYQINTHATSVAGTCLASYLVALGKTDRVYVGAIGDEDDPKMVKLFVKIREEGSDMGELQRLTPVSRAGLKTQADRLAYCAEQYGAATDLPKFDPRPDGSAGDGSAPDTGAFENAGIALLEAGYPAITETNFPVYAPVFAKYIKAKTGVEVLKTELAHPLSETYATDAWNAIAYGIRKFWLGDPKAKPQDAWGEPEGLKALRLANAAEEYDPFADGSI